MCYIEQFEEGRYLNVLTTVGSRTSHTTQEIFSQHHLFLSAVRVAELNDEKVDSLSRESVLGSASTKMANNDRWHYFSVAPYLKHCLPDRSGILSN